MKTSPAGRALIKRHEGLRLRTYIDPVGVLTIGYGHTGHAARAGNEITKEKAELLLTEDLREAEDAIVRLVHVNLSESQFDALASFVFNVGVGSFKASTLLRELNAGNYAAVPGQLRRWVFGTVKGQKVILPGLVKRRSDECVLWLSAAAVDDDATEGGVIAEPPPVERTAPAAAGLATAAAAAAPVLQSIVGGTPSTVATVAAVLLLGYVVYRLTRSRA